MAITRITIEEFLALAKEHPVLDVRSPGEFAHAHIPGAHSLPLFTDEERKVVGTAYKQESQQKAIKLGLDYFGVKMVKMVEEVENLFTLPETKHKVQDEENPVFRNSKTVLVHCWRGGMRSAGVAWMLDLYGFKVYTLVGGYKTYRNWVLEQFEKDYPIRIIGGYTGSGKTEVLHTMAKKGENIIDLEGLAHHKGSAFGSLGQPTQPSQEMFENLLVRELKRMVDASPIPCSIWLEDESQRIGEVNIPTVFFKTMRSKKVYFLDIPFESRLDFIVRGYGKFEKDKLISAIIRIKKRLGGLETKTAVNFLIEDNIRECFSVLLHYYDKYYLKGLHGRDNFNELFNKIESDVVDDEANAARLLQACGIKK
jgi:tRNA 2-selenouridine synthase